MQQQLGRVPAIVRRLDFVREWKEWKSMYGVIGVPGITGKGSPHWYRCSALRGAGPQRAYRGQSWSSAFGRGRAPSPCRCRLCPHESSSQYRYHRTLPSPADVPPELAQRIPPGGHPDDIVFSIKEFMASRELCQDIVTVLPASLPPVVLTDNPSATPQRRGDGQGAAKTVASARGGGRGKGRGERFRHEFWGI